MKLPELSKQGTLEYAIEHLRAVAAGGVKARAVIDFSGDDATIRYQWGEGKDGLTPDTICKIAEATATADKKH
jgi:hypothetical protein